LYKKKRAEQKKSKKDTEQYNILFLLALKDYRNAALSINKILRDIRAA